jgi:putative endonuclease
MRKNSAHSIGWWSEWFACGWLWIKGYQILKRRWRFPGGEIDIIARHRHFLVFIEVKHRPTLLWASEAIHRRQQQRLARGAAVFVRRHQKFSQYQSRLDAILIAPGHWPQHIQNAFGGLS